MSARTLDSIATWIVVGLLFLLPIFVIPLLSVPFQFAKSALLGIGLFVALILWIVARLKSNEISIPKSPLLGLGVLLLIVYALSATFSGNSVKSFVGQGFEVDTFLAMTLMVVALFLGSVLFTSKKKVTHLFLAVTCSFIIFALFQFIRLIAGPDVLSLNLFFSPTANLLGKWNDVAIFSGIAAILAMTGIAFFRAHIGLKVLFYLSLIASLVLLVIVNFSVVWLSLAGISFLILIKFFFDSKLSAGASNNGTGEGVSDTVNSEYTADSTNTNETSRISSVVILVFVLSLLLIFSGGAIENYVSSQLNIFQVEARPSWQSTFNILKTVYPEQAMLGVGPNNFGSNWLLHKPVGVNNTPFWNTDFALGVGLIPTLFITTGVLGGVVWLLFLGFLLFISIRTFLSFRGKEELDQAVILTPLFVSVFLWVAAIFYVPHVTLFFMAFLFTGVFLAMLRNSKMGSSYIISFQNNPRIGFVSIILLFVILIGSVAGIYTTGGKFASAMYIQKATISANVDGDIAGAQRNIEKAILFNTSDRVYRAASEVALAQIAQLVASNQNTPEVQRAFQTALGFAVEHAQRAVNIDNENYLNWVSLGRVYGSLVSLQIGGAYDNAKVAYARASELNPNSPLLRLELARIETLNGNNATAREYITEALQLKNNYTDAIFLLSQIEINEGNVQEAINSVEAATIINPNDSLALFQLGLLKYSKDDFVGAGNAFSRAVAINPQYSNARYFLGLSFYQTSQVPEAIQQFEAVEVLNPDNLEVKAILSNLREGKAPLENLNPPADAPEERGELPIVE